MLPKKPKIIAILQFNEEMLNRMIAYKYQGTDEPPQVSQFTKEQFRDLALQIQGSVDFFTDDIVESCKQDDPWLVDFVKQFEKK